MSIPGCNLSILQYAVMFLLTTKNRFICPSYMKVCIQILGFQGYQLLFYPFLVMHCSYFLSGSYQTLK